MVKNCCMNFFKRKDHREIYRYKHYGKSSEVHDELSSSNFAITKLWYNIDKPFPKDYTFDITPDSLNVRRCRRDKNRG